MKRDPERNLNGPSPPQRVILCGVILACVISVCHFRQGRAANGNSESVTADGKADAFVASGPKVGATIHPFFVRAVTGPHRNRSVCYVCRYGGRPVVMVLIQKVDPKIGALLTTLDAIIDDNRVSGLRGFGVLITDQSSRAVPILQTIAFDEKVHMPLTAATTAIAGSGGQNLHPDAATTIVLYRGQKAVDAIPLRNGQIDAKELRKIRERILKFVKRPKSK